MKDILPKTLVSKENGAIYGTNKGITTWHQLDQMIIKKLSGKPLWVCLQEPNEKYDILFTKYEELKKVNSFLLDEIERIGKVLKKNGLE